MTLSEFQSILPTTKADRVIEVYNQLTPCFAKYSINTPLRKCHFLAQMLHETGALRYKEEIASGKAYEGRVDLGNIVKGDGVLFKGRGAIQLTGRTNYDKYGRFIGVDLLANPKLVAENYYVDVAGWFWNSKGLNSYADKDDVMIITRRINGGINGLEDRKLWLSKLKKVYGIA